MKPRSANRSTFPPGTGWNARMSLEETLTRPTWRSRQTALMNDSPRDVPEIREAIALFEAWEASINDLEAAKGFTEAVQILDDFLESDPQTPHRSFVHNLKISHTRRLLQQLAKVDRADFSLWLEYAVSAVAAVSNEAESLMKANP